MTPREKQLLDFIESELAASGGVGPTFDEMREHLGVASKGVVHRLLLSLERQARIEREPARARGVRVTNPDLSAASDAALLAEAARRGFLQVAA